MWFRFLTHLVSRREIAALQREARLGTAQALSSRMKAVKRRIPVILLLTLIGVLIVGAFLAWVAGREEGRKEIKYKNKPVSKWFCDQRKDFFSLAKRDAADDAFKALGTNALPFLLSNLKN